VRSGSRQDGQTRASFIEEARRTQIVDTAIRTIAARGYSKASLAEIAREAGISKGVISYHFQGKEDLLHAILARLLREPAEFIKERVGGCESALEKLSAYVRANFEFMRAHRSHYAALVDLWHGRDASEERCRFDAEAYAPSRGYLSKVLEAGAASGEIRALPAGTTASVIQAAIDGVMLQWIFDPRAVDIDACADEIIRMVARHVRAEGTS
jgi:AcrR family transcriptional regulator